MKTKYWVMLLSAVFLLCLGLSLPLLHPGEDARFAEIHSQGQLVRTVDLHIDQQFTITTPQNGTNVITVQNGKIAVTEATCPDHYCLERGFCSGGTQIVCLPNRLVIRFSGKQSVDSVVE